MRVDDIIFYMKHSRKNILFVSYHFPPSSAVGGMRIYYFAKYLKKLKWDISVLTVDDDFITDFDHERAAKNNLIKIVKAKKIPKLTNTIIKFSKYLKSKIKSKEKNLLNIDKEKKEKRENVLMNDNLKRKILRNIDSFILIPDENRNWIIPALFKGCREIEKNNINLVFTSCPPYSSHLIGLLLKILYDIVWVADFRDPWVKPFNKHLYPVSKGSLVIEKILENKVIKSADLVITTTFKLNHEFRKIYSKQKKEKFFFLTNGYDGEIFEKIKDGGRYEKFTITYMGTLYFGRSPEPVFKALKRLKEKKMINRGEIIFQLVGNCQYVNGEMTKDMVARYELQEEVVVKNSVSHGEAIRQIHKSDIGLVLAPNQAYQIPGKIYDIIGAGTKILAVTNEGATKELIKSLGAGGSYDMSDIDGITDFIYNEYIRRGENREILSKIKRQFDQRMISIRLDRKLCEIMKFDS